MTASPWAYAGALPSPTWCDRWQRIDGRWRRVTGDAIRSVTGRGGRRGRARRRRRA